LAHRLIRTTFVVLLGCFEEAFFMKRKIKGKAACC
jgi:hypothetical protein